MFLDLFIIFKAVVLQLMSACFSGTCGVENFQTSGCSLQVAVVIFTSSECNLGRCHNVVPTWGCSSHSGCVYQSELGGMVVWWSQISVWGGLQIDGAWPLHCCCCFFFIDQARKSHWSDCTVSVTGSLHGRALGH